MLKNLLTAIVLIVIALGLFINSRPDEFKVSRSLNTYAPPEQVFAHLNDLHMWNEWSPWVKLDPAAKISFDGPSSGVNSHMSWNGNDNVGEGTMTITDSQMPSLVRYRLDFVRPFESTAEAHFTLTPKDGGSEVTWTMEGRNNFMSKAIGLFMNCEEMVGTQFEQGLLNLKAVVDKDIR